MSEEKSVKVTRFLEWITPQGGLESLAEQPSVLEGIERDALVG